MDKIQAEGGWVNEAVEIGLWYANLEVDKGGVSQVVLIGDAPANTQDEVTQKREKHGEAYWGNSKFKQPTFYKTELEKLKKKGIPVHAFFVNRKAEANFKEIAKETGGRCKLLDINSSAGAEKLTNLVTKEILRNVGQSNGRGDDLVDAYRNRYIKSFK